jgi:hypothetical protein
MQMCHNFLYGVTEYAVYKASIAYECLKQKSAHIDCPRKEHIEFRGMRMLWMIEFLIFFLHITLCFLPITRHNIFISLVASEQTTISSLEKLKS